MTVLPQQSKAIQLQAKTLQQIQATIVDFAIAMALNPPPPSRPLPELLKLRKSFPGSTDEDHREWIKTNNITLRRKN
ncbi:MAG: hypothetical protein OXI36_07695 [Gammaproteobacteria bacterium]|nr:hypothetical protein [Gammaproteobacteria bacterium]MDE0403291.1 hypothetical protein [Gammaproteobacteria bacterium]